MCKCRHIIFPYENCNNMRLVFSLCAPAQRHLTWELKQNTCEPGNASTIILCIMITYNMGETMNEIMWIIKWFSTWGPLFHSD